MEDERDRIEELAESARRLPVAERRAFLDGFRLEEDVRRAVEARIAMDPTRIPPRDEALEPTVALRPDAATAPAMDGARAARVAADALDPLLGRAFAGIAVERIIGSGGMGRVYLGTDSATGARVALKVLLRTQRDEGVRRRFDREGRLLERLRHPGIAGVLRTGIEQDADVDVPYIVMDFVDGAQGIADHVFRERLGARETVDVFLQACDAVGHAHREGFVHRDIKPPNILVDRHGRVKVIDFGVARAISVDPSAMTVRTETGQIVGTMQYMSPEQFLADPRGIDARTDVYALCAVLYELLTGVQPHDLRSLPVHEAARTVCETDAPDVRRCNPRIDSRLADIVMDGLAREKSRRPDDAGVLALRLRGWLAGPSREPSDGPAAPREVAAPSTRLGVPAPPSRAGAPSAGAAPGKGGGMGWLPVASIALAVAAAIALALGPRETVQAVLRIFGAAPSAPGAGAPAGTAPGTGGASPGAAGAASPALVQLRVRTAPAGASIAVDGEPRGRSPAVVLLPPGRPHRVEAALDGWETFTAVWRDGEGELGLNLEPRADVGTLPRLLTVDAGQLPRGASLRAVAPVALQLGPGINRIEVSFERAADGSWAAPPLVLEARDAAGRPLRIEHGTRESEGSAEIALRAEEAGARIRVRVR
jgi:predicted Ser/Thr protein kinase